jgi:hypothetical protein
MRLAPVVLLLLASTAAAHAEPALATAEVRLGYGLATGGGAGRAAMRTSPLMLTFGGAIAIRDQPRTSGYVDVVIETLDRTGAGGEAGLMLTPSDKVRLRAGAIAIVRPYTLWGAALGGSVCRPFAGVRACGDVSADIFVGGTDLPAKTAVVQVLAGLSVVIDVR